MEAYSKHSTEPLNDIVKFSYELAQITQDYSDEVIGKKQKEILSLFSLIFEEETSSYLKIQEILPTLFKNLSDSTELLIDFSSKHPFMPESEAADDIIGDCYRILLAKINCFPVLSLNENEKKLFRKLELYQIPHYKSVTIPAVIADKKFSFDSSKRETAENEILSAAKEAKNIKKQIANERKEFENIAEQYLSSFKIELDNSSSNLGKSFQRFKFFKNLERVISLLFTTGLAFLALYSVYWSITSNFWDAKHFYELSSIKTGEGTVRQVALPIYVILLSRGGFILGELLIVYFFRIALNNYYSARDEVLQLGIRESLCRFIPAYREFCKDNSCNLDEFAKHIFSPLNSRMTPAPHPMDFLGQLSQVMGGGKGENKGSGK